MNRFEHQKVKELMQIVFEKQSFSATEAYDIADVIMLSDLFGIESHGCQRFKMYLDNIASGRVQIKNRPKMVQETPLSAVIDANAYMGQVVSINATNIAIEKAKQSGIAIVCVRSSNHYGIAGYYARKIALEGLIGISMTNTEAIMIPTFGKHAMIGTNPIALAMPAQPYPFLFDASTTVVPRGKLEVYMKNETEIPLGWGVDATGEGTTQPKIVDDCIKVKKGGGILPLGGEGTLFGGHKGYGLGMMVEIMTGIIASGFTSDLVRSHEEVEGSCHTFIAIDYGMFGEKSEIEKNFSDYLNKIRLSGQKDVSQCIYTHGEKEALAYEDRLKNGIYMNDKTYNEIKDICMQHGLDPTIYLCRLD